MLKMKSVTIKPLLGPFSKWNMPRTAYLNIICYNHENKLKSKTNEGICLAAIPALQHVVYDLFLLRGSAKSDVSKDLETQREVVVSMLIRLINYYQVRAKQNTSNAHH